MASDWGLRERREEELKGWREGLNTIGMDDMYGMIGNLPDSASRGALLEAWKLFNYWRTWWVTNFCQPIYEEWLNEAVLRGRVKAPGFLEDPMIRYAYSWAD